MWPSGKTIGVIQQCVKTPSYSLVQTSPKFFEIILACNKDKKMIKVNNLQQKLKHERVVLYCGIDVIDVHDQLV